MQNEVARFSGTDAAYIVDVLRSAYGVLDAADTHSESGMDCESKLLLGDFIAALDECDVIVIVDDEEFLVDEA